MAQNDVDNLFDPMRYETNFLSDILILLKPKVLTPRNPKRISFNE